MFVCSGRPPSAQTPLIAGVCCAIKIKHLHALEYIHIAYLPICMKIDFFIDFFLISEFKKIKAAMLIRRSIT